MKIRLAILVMAVAILGLFLLPKTTTVKNDVEAPTIQQPQLNTLIRGFLTSKESPLAPETDFLLQQKHWKLLIAVSAIESQYCKRKIAFNCFGIGWDSAYRHYSSIRAAIQDANDLIEHWQTEHKRWLTVEDMNGSYVVPANPNWVRVVNKVLAELETYERQSTGTIHQ